MVIAVLVVLGLCLGSFVNALVWRIHEQGLRAEGRGLSKETKQPSTKDLSILNGRSMCTDCQHTLAWYDLVPVISWLSLRGKCRYCHNPISYQYPLVEFTAAILFVFSYLYFPSPITNLQSSILFSLWLIFLTGFMALVIYDLRWMILPNQIVFPLQALAVVYAVIALLATGQGVAGLIWVILGVLCSAGVFYALFQISGGKWIGGGDVKLAVVLGLLLAGPAKVALMLFIASSVGSLISIPLLVTGRYKSDSRLPFGPLLIIGTIIVYLFGTSIIAWYERQLLFV